MRRNLCTCILFGLVLRLIPSSSALLSVEVQCPAPVVLCRARPVRGTLPRRADVPGTCRRQGTGSLGGVNRQGVETREAPLKRAEALRPPLTAGGALRPRDRHGTEQPRGRDPGRGGSGTRRR